MLRTCSNLQTLTSTCNSLQSPFLLASRLHTTTFCKNILLNNSADSESLSEALVVEILITLALVFANCATWDPRSKHLVDSVSLRFGVIVAGLNFAAATYTGASMNPARSFGPALWNNDWYLHWIYWVGPLTSAVIGSVIYKYLFLKTNFQHYTYS